MRSLCCSLTLLLSFWYCSSLCSVLSFLGNGVFCSVLPPLWVCCCVVLITFPPSSGLVLWCLFSTCSFFLVHFTSRTCVHAFFRVSRSCSLFVSCLWCACVHPSARALSLSLSSPVSPSSSLSVYECECVGVHAFVCKYSCVCLLAFACVGVCGFV